MGDKEQWPGVWQWSATGHHPMRSESPFKPSQTSRFPAAVEAATEKDVDDDDFNIRDYFHDDAFESEDEDATGENNDAALTNNLFSTISNSRPEDQTHCALPPARALWHRSRHHIPQPSFYHVIFLTGSG